MDARNRQFDAVQILPQRAAGQADLRATRRAADFRAGIA
jgi:hypothetical protein